MRKAGLIAATVLLGVFCVKAQQVVNSAAGKAAKADVFVAGAGDGLDRPGGKTNVPPDKLRPIVIPKTSAPPVIDGRIDDNGWSHAAVFKEFYQTSPGYNTAPSKPTEVYLFYDEKNLYIAFKCWDDRDKIRATVAKRDSLGDEDNVTVWLDTYDDRRRAYALSFNPLGVQQDGIFTEGQFQGADLSVDIVMESKGVIEDWGWSVEVTIPFKSLRYQAGKGKMWGFNAARTIARLNGEVDRWLPDDREVSGFLIKHGKITGLDEIKSERTLEIIPSVTVSQTGRRKRTIPPSGFAPFGQFNPIFNPIGLKDPGKFTNDPAKADLSLSLKYTLSPNVTLDAAINPDYAEIEADAPVVTANQRFPIFFPEKRPFFLEGKDIFDTPLQAFHSRTIVDPDFAAKLTGKIGANTFGLVVTSDNAPGNYSEDERGVIAECQRARLLDPPNNRRTCANEEFIDKNALFGVLRLKRDIGMENRIGFFAAIKIFPKSRNIVGGFDGRFKLDPRTVMSFQVLGTHSKKYFYDPISNKTNYRDGNGFGYYWNLDYTAETRGWFAEISGRSGDYRADAGFTSRTNTNQVFFMNRLSTKSKPNAALIKADSRQMLRYYFDWMGRVQYANAGANLSLQFQKSLVLNAAGGMHFEKDHEEEFGPKRNAATGQAGAFHGAPTRSTEQPYISGSISKTFGKQFSVSGLIGRISNAMDYDFGGNPKYTRASPAFRAYLNSAQYQNYLRLMYQYQANPIGAPPSLNALAPPPALDPGKGTNTFAQADFVYKPVDSLRISLDYNRNKLTRNDTRQTAYNVNIYSFRSTYQFTRFTFIRARLDYNTLQATASGQLLFGWNPNPGTAFYVGYNDNLNYNGYSPLTGQFEPGLQRNSRTLFIRASYLFRKNL